MQRNKNHTSMSGERIYQKAVEMEKEEAEVIAPIEAEANINCALLKTRPLAFPGLPNNSFISSQS